MALATATALSKVLDIPLERFAQDKSFLGKEEDEHDDDIISAFLKTIEHKKCEVLLFKEL